VGEPAGKKYKQHPEVQKITEARKDRKTSKKKLLKGGGGAKIGGRGEETKEGIKALVAAHASSGKREDWGEKTLDQKRRSKRGDSIAKEEGSR